MANTADIASAEEEESPRFGARSARQRGDTRIDSSDSAASAPAAMTKSADAESTSGSTFEAASEPFSIEDQDATQRRMASPAVPQAGGNSAAPATRKTTQVQEFYFTVPKLHPLPDAHASLLRRLAI
jgi:hypothetical protein